MICRTSVYLLIIFGFFSCNSAEETVTKPDVLFIAIDDMNDWTGCLGGMPNSITPNLDRLASKSVLFSNAHCSAPACNPSRASVMTGVSPSTSGVYANQNEWRKYPALKNAKTIPEYFRELGYSVKGGGKIFHALSWIQSSYGKDQNDPTIWDEYFPSKQRQLPESIWPEPYKIDSIGTARWENIAGYGTEKRPNYFFDYGPFGLEEEMPDYKVVEWAVDELKKRHDKPLFLATGIFRPHIPWFVPKKYFDLYPLDEIVEPEIREGDLDDISSVPRGWLRRDWHKWMIENDEWKKAIQAYRASISFSDAMLGMLLKGLEESGKADNTIVVLWSDHGMHIGEKEHWEKFTLWEQSTRVPLIVNAPGVTPKNGAECKEAVSLLDVFPTLVNLTKGEIFSQLEGKSLVPLLEDANASRPEPAITTFHYNNHSVRDERWRYIRYHNGDEELYDHDTDPNEFTNLAGDENYTNIIVQLKKWLPEKNFKEEKYIDN